MKIKPALLIIVLSILLSVLSACTKNEPNEENTQINNHPKDEKITTTPSPSPTTIKEQEVATFSTPLKSKSPNRLNNIKITCNALNDTIVEPQKEFSFCSTVGKATSEKGYKKADVIIDKKVEQALGGGNCQVSTTLYNAVLAVKDLTVTERHPHGKDVTYVPDGKDAAVSFGSKDLKFVNHFSTPIKIYASTDEKTVTVKIVNLVNE